MWLKAPYLKKKGFNPMPVVRGGIPREADSRLNPKVWGTPPWESFWKDQLHCVIHGWQTGGWFLPGRFYYYLNFNDMSTLEGVRTPDMCDLHLELCYFMEHCLQNGKNGIIPKKRRAGVSEVFHKAGLDYGWRFFPGFRGGVAAGKKTYADEFMQKWDTSEAMLVPEFSVKRLKSNQNKIIAGYTTKNELGESVDRGTRNTIQIETMFQDSDLFKGIYTNLIIAEECGQFPKLEEFYDASRACVLVGEVQKGSMFFFGTAGRMDKESKGLKEIWEKPDMFNCERMPIEGPRFLIPYYGGATNSNGEVIQKIPNLLEKHKPHEVIGVEDLEAAKETLIKERQHLFKHGRTEKYQKHIKEFPLTIAEIFIKTVTNVFDTECMQNQADKIDAEKSRRYLKCRLEYKKDSKGEIKHPFEVECILDNESPEDECWLIHRDFLQGAATFNMPKLFFSGVDSYDQDKAKTSKSKGAMAIGIRRNTVHEMQMAPVAVLCVRPRRKEIFYDMCLKASIFFNLQEETLIDVANKLIFKFYEEKGCINYLAYRPKKFEGEKSDQTHTWGFHINNHSKPQMVGLMQGNILDYFHHCWFPELINQCQNYDEVEIGSDNDLADAWGIALIQEANEVVQVEKRSEEDERKVFQLQEWVTDRNGNKVPKGEEQPDLLHIEKDHPSRFGSF